MTKLKTLISKNKSRLISVLSVFIFLLGISNLYVTTSVIPISNDECLWVTKISPDKKDTVLVIQQVKVNGVTWNAGIRNGDKLLAINGIPLRRADVAMLIINKMEAGQYAKYTVERNSRIFYTTVYIKKLMDFGLLGFVLLGFIWFIVGFVVLNAKPDGIIQRLFYAVGCLFTVCFSMNYIQINFPDNFIVMNLPVLYLWVSLCVFSIAYLSFTYLYFFFSFPQPFRFVKKNGAKKFFAWFPAVLSLIFLAYSFIRYDLPGDIVPVFEKINFFNKVLLFSFVTGMISLLISYRRLKSAEEKKPIFIILLAYVLGIASLIYTSFIARILTDNLFNSPEYFTPVILIVLIPVAFGYSIFKYQLMDVSIVVKNTIVYGTATIAIAVIYLLTMYGVGQGIGSAVGTEYRSAIAAFTFVLFALVFQSTKDRFQDLLTRKFYPEQFTYQQVIFRFSSDVISIVGRDNILKSMKDTFVNSLKISKFGILLKDSESGMFRLTKHYGISDDSLSLQGQGPWLTGYVREKLVMQSPVTIEQSQFEEIFPADFSKLNSEEIFTVVPMIIKGKVIGLLLFGLKYSGSQFAGKDIDLLCAAASQAAVAIENARLYEAEAEKITIERDLTLAKRIQQSLLPKCIPDMQGIELCGLMYPAMLVGGDYYDFIRVSPTKLFVVVGDVSGKGLSASLYMTKLQTMMTLYCTEDRSPREVLIDVNRKIYDGMERNWFITVSLALIDTERSVLKFCRAGHLPLVAVENNEVKYFEPRGLGLGLDDGRIFDNSLEEVDIPYNAGSTFVFFSDGITEAMDHSDELYGMERLSELLVADTNLTASQISSKIIDSIENYRGDREQNDDITLVTLKIK